MCALQWSQHERELLSSHGYSQNQLCLWRYPSMTKMAEVSGHTARVLHLAQVRNTLVTVEQQHSIELSPGSEQKHAVENWMAVRLDGWSHTLQCIVHFTTVYDSHLTRVQYNKH